MIPSLSDYALGDAALHSALWRACRFAYCPSLGNTGPKVYELLNGQSAAISNYVASAWVYDSGLPVVENTESGTNTNRASYWTDLSIPSNVASYSLWIYSAGQTTALGCPITSGTTGTTFRMNVATTGIVSTSWGNGLLTRTAPASLTANTWTHVVSQRTRGGNAVELWIDGVLVDSAATGSTSTVGDSSVISVLARNDSGTFASRFAGRVDDVRVYSRMLPPDEVRLLASQRAIAYVPRGRRLLRSAWPFADEVTGTTAVTLSGATATATGTQTHSGTAAISTDGATATASGTQTHSGTAAVTLSGATATATSTQTHSGTAAVTLGAAAASASGSALEGVVGAATVTLAAVAAAASGTQTHTGTGAATTTGPSAAASGQTTEPTSGVVHHLLGPVTATGSGAVTVTGSVAITSGTVSSTSSGLAGVTGTGQATAGAVCVSTGLVGSGGAVTVTTSGVGVTLVGSVTAVGSVAVTTGTATITASGLVPVVDVSLTGSIDRPALTGRIDVQALTGRIAVETLGGKKLWR